MSSPDANALVAPFRTWLGLTQSEFAECCGVTRSTVARWEAAEPVPVPSWLGDALVLDRISKLPKSRSERLGREAGKATLAALASMFRREQKGEAASAVTPHPRLVLIAALEGPSTLILNLRSLKLLTENQIRGVYRKEPE
jgi:transcriptional regulator with XRE-family HTH domain